MNNTNVSSDDSSEFELPDEPILKILDITFICLGIVTGTVGNLLTVLSVTRFKHMKSATNFLVVNIGMADLFVAVYSLPTILANRVAGFNVFHEIICKVNGYALFTVAGVSNFSFTLIAVARNMCVLNQPAYRRIFTHTKVLIYCAICWISWFILSGIFWFLQGFGYISQAFICFYYDDEAPFYLSFMLTLLGVAVPSLLAAGCYISLFVRLFKIRREAETSVMDGPVTSTSKEWKALAPVLTAYIVFNLCWGPYSIHVYIDRFVHPVGRIPHKVITWLAVFNSTLNPIIYGLLNSNFRRGYVRIFRTLCSCRPPAVGTTMTMTAGEMSIAGREEFVA